MGLKSRTLKLRYVSETEFKTDLSLTIIFVFAVSHLTYMKVKTCRCSLSKVSLVYRSTFWLVAKCVKKTFVPLGKLHMNSIRIYSYAKFPSFSPNQVIGEISLMVLFP